MVYFICCNCGDSVKKAKVEKHYLTKCRNQGIHVSCMDCQKDFHNDEYVAHTRCISEAQKYSGKGYVEKPSQNKGQKKQEMWTEIIHSILQNSEYNLKPKIRDIFEKLQNFENVPRKKEKFKNFVKNSLRIREEKIEVVWAILEKELDKMKQSSVPGNVHSNVNGKVNDTAEAAMVMDVTEPEISNSVVMGNDDLLANGNLEFVKFRKAIRKCGQKYGQGIDINILKERLKMRYDETFLHGELGNEQSNEFENRISNPLDQSSNAGITLNNFKSPIPGDIFSLQRKEKIHLVWKVLEEELDKMHKPPEEENPQAVVNEPSNNVTEKTKKKKEKEPTKKNNTQQHEEPINQNVEVFKIRIALENYMQKYPDGVNINKLKQKLKRKYRQHRFITEWDDEQDSKFEKKFNKALKKLPGVEISDDIVRRSIQKE